MKIKKITFSAITGVASVFVFSVVSAFAAYTLFGSAVNYGGMIEAESILSNVSTADDFGGSTFDDANGSFIGSLTNLSTDFNVTNDDCIGGSPRFSIRVDYDNDNSVSGGDKNVFVYLGPYPNYTGCTQNTWVSSGNLITDPNNRWDTSQVGGTFYDTFANASSLTSTNEILRISLVVDAGWGFSDNEQTIQFDNVVINSSSYTFPTPTLTPIPTTTPSPTPNPFAVPAECSNVSGGFPNAPIIGTSASEKINGTNGNDLIFALGGSDKVDGKGGNDCIVGGSGSDSLTGGNGDDVILGGDGSDSLKGDGGNDDLYGENGSDSIKGGSGNDDLFGGDNSDSLKGDGGMDTSDGGNGSDTCNAETESACEA